MWLNKYKPKNLNKFVGNHKLIYSLNNWYKKGDNNIVIVNGQTGVGKTLLAELFLKEHNYTIKTFSNCEELSNNILKDKINNFFNFQNILEIMNNKKVGVIIKDVDNILTDIIKIISNASIKRLVFIITNTNLKKLNKKLFILQFIKPNYNDIENFILEITLENKFYLNNKGIKLLYEYSNGDVRYIINFLEDLFMNIKIKNNTSTIINVTIEQINDFITTKEKDIDYSLFDLVNQLIFKKNTINNTLKYVYHDIYFLPTIIYDNLHILLKYNNLEYYYKCMKSIVYSEYLNIKEFENQSSTSNDIQLILNTHLPNYYFNICKIDKCKLSFSVLMNKLLKYNNSKKYYINFELNNIKTNYFKEIIKFLIYLDEKTSQKNIENIIEVLQNLKIDIKKLFKYYNIQ